MSRSLEQWLDYQQLVHARGIDLGLERVRTVWIKLGAPAVAGTIISVGGTNGKGSTVAFLEAMLRADGKRVGCYTSPHLLRYNERIRIAGDDAADSRLVDAFERIEAARESVSLTYFEFATLAALLIFAESRLDVAVMEVGLGGRLDAVNLIDAHAAIVTTIDLDHQDWLGNDRDSIGREKAGIFRAGCPAIIGETSPPQSLVESALACGAQVLRAGVDFSAISDANGWVWRSGPISLALPAPAQPGTFQLANAAAGIALLHSLRERLGWNPLAIATGLRSARIAARLQRFRIGSVELVIDVAHNPQAAQSLADWLHIGAASPAASTLAVFSALGDKDIDGIVAAMAGAVSCWFLAGLDQQAARGLPVETILQQVQQRIPAENCRAATSVSAALTLAMEHARPGDRVVAFGSFFVAADALRWAQRHAVAIDGPMPVPAQV